MNALIEGWDAADDTRRIWSRARTISEHFAVEAPLLKPLPVDRCGTGRRSSPKADRYSQVAVQTNHYSVRPA
ncbi:hypothetical protein [Nocardia sp. NPDC004750]